MRSKTAATKHRRAASGPDGQQLTLDLAPRPAPTAPPPPDPLAEERARYAAKVLAWERAYWEKLDRQAAEAREERRRRATEPSLALRVSWIERAWERRAGRAR